jgi:CheY-like chemotaxis protein
MIFVFCAAVLLVGTAMITALLIRRTDRPYRDRARAADTPMEPRPAAAPADPDRLRTVLLSRMSHDLRSPLNSVITLSQLLCEGNAGPLTNQQRSYVEVIQRNGRTLLSLMNDILDLAAGDERDDSERAPVGRTEPPHGESTPSPSAEDSGHEPVTGAAGGSVLLIEDDGIERERVGGLLEQAGFQVTPAGSGEEGLTLLRTRRFDAVVLDLVMPGLTGLDVLRAARVEERLGDIPFIVLSALYMTKTERAVLGPGVVSVVRKGDANADELALALRRAIRRPAEEHVGQGPGDDHRHA